MTPEHRARLTCNVCRHVPGGVCDRCLLIAIKEDREFTARMIIGHTPDIGETLAKQMAADCRTGDA